MKFKINTFNLYILSSGEKFLIFLLDKDNFLWYNNMMMKLLNHNLSFSQQFKDGNEESYINKSKTIIENLPVIQKSLQK